MKTTVYLDDAEYRRLKRLAERRQTSAAELIREAVCHLLETPGDDQLPLSFGLGPRAVLPEVDHLARARLGDPVAGAFLDDIAGGRSGSGHERW